MGFDHRRTSRTGVNAATFTYGDATHKHAVTAVGGTSYGYDPNGNMTSRASDAFTYDYENRLTQATVGGVVTQYVYNGDGARVKKVVGSTATYYIGNWYEVTNGTATKYYYFGAQRVAMKQGSTLTYLHGDHLGSTSVASTDTGTFHSRQTYYAFGVPRTTEGTLPTDFTFTGQRADSYIKLIQMGARWYDPEIGRFTQPDSIIPDPGNPQSLNRFAYVKNNPVRYTDPTGHRSCGDPQEEDCDNPGGIGKPGTWEPEPQTPPDIAPVLPAKTKSQSYLPFNATVSPFGGYLQGNFFVVGGRINLNLVLDAQGNWAIVFVPEGGPAAGVGISGGVSGYITDATNITEQINKPLTSSAGGSWGTGVAVGLDAIIAEKMKGVSLSIGGGLYDLAPFPVPVEFHWYMSNSSWVPIQGKYDFWNW